MLYNEIQDFQRPYFLNANTSKQIKVFDDNNGRDKR